MRSRWLDVEAAGEEEDQNRDHGIQHQILHAAAKVTLLKFLNSLRERQLYGVNAAFHEYLRLPVE